MHLEGTITTLNGQVRHCEQNKTRLMGVLDLDDPLYEAFSRDDQYGALGKKGQSLAEKIRLIVLGLTLVPLRLFGCVYFVIAFYLTCRYENVVQ